MTDDEYVSFLGVRHQAIMQIAMHDALTPSTQVRPIRLLRPLEGRGTDRGRGEGGARRARGGLSAQQATLDAELATWVAPMPSGSGKTKALKLGAKAAMAIVALRQDDCTDVDLWPRLHAGHPAG